MKLVYRYISVCIAILLSFTVIVKGQDYASSSVLFTGNWHTIKVLREGVVKITYDDMAAVGLTGGLPAIYGNNSGRLSYYNDDPSPDDLKPVPVWLELGSDSEFNSGDYILFWAAGNHRWDFNGSTYNFRRHYYADTITYFITTSASSQKIDTDNNIYTENRVSQFYDQLFIHEEEISNILKSGRQWYEPVPTIAPLTIYPGFEDYIPEPGEDIRLDIRVLGRSSNLTLFRLNSGTSTIANMEVTQVNVLNTAGTYASAVTDSVFIPGEGVAPGLALEYHNNGDNSARGWLDYIKILMRAKIRYNNDLLTIRDSRSAGVGNITRFDIETSSNDLLVWDVSVNSAVKNIPVSTNSGIVSFIAPTDSLRTFAVFRKQDAIRPVISPDPVPNQNLHAPGEYDMIIVTHPLFKRYADEISELHFEKDGLVSLVVTPQQIYNEFSGGIPDISAIRNYVRMVYTRNKNGSRPLKYLLLLGDGSYENRTPPPANPNYIPTYQTDNSNVNVLSFISDDYYALLDPGEGESTGYIDIGVGRLPVYDTLQARTLVNKIKTYLDPSTAGPWRNRICMVADDEDNNAHINDAESLSSLLNNTAPYINIEKVYFDSFRQETSISGDSYPEATASIDRKIESGCLIFNYLGHGNELGLAHERVVKTENINSWRNSDKLPVFITATCEFSRFDDIDIDEGTGEITPKPSAGEMVLLNPDGGGIALLTTTRIVYSAPNYILNNRIYQYAFDKDNNNEGLTLGRIVQLAKNNAGAGDNKRNFTLLGDPALRLAYPWHGSVVTDSVNGQPVQAIDDTVRALSTVTIKGHIEDNEGNLLTSASGLVYPTLFDKPVNITTLANDGGNTFEFSALESKLFNGKAEIDDGRFSFTFIVPRDINFTYGNGKLSYFAKTGDNDYTGYSNDIVIGGFNNVANDDTTGPVIRLFLNDTLFLPGGITDNSPSLLALISDHGGINTTGSGLGHDIVMYIDDKRSNSVVLNNYYENIVGSYISGSLTYPMGYFEDGSHTVTLKAWDNYNNSSSETLQFLVRENGKFTLNKLVNWPNPVNEITQISVGHNRPGKEIVIDIAIFSSGGKMVKRIRQSQFTGGYQLEPILWDGLDDGGNRVGRGIYIYNVLITTDEGEKARISGRMIIL